MGSVKAFGILVETRGRGSKSPGSPTSHGIAGNRTKPTETYANLGSVAMTSVKAFGILVDGKGEDMDRRHRASSPTSGKPKILNHKIPKGHGGDRRTLRRIGAKSLKPTPIWDAVG
jgi:hypothetical protein